MAALHGIRRDRDVAEAPVGEAETPPVDAIVRESAEPGLVTAGQRRNALATPFWTKDETSRRRDFAIRDTCLDSSGGRPAQVPGAGPDD